jgi:hypothetical protein
VFKGYEFDLPGLQFALKKLFQINVGALSALWSLVVNNFLSLFCLSFRVKVRENGSEDVLTLWTDVPEFVYATQFIGGTSFYIIMDDFPLKLSTIVADL